MKERGDGPSHTGALYEPTPHERSKRSEPAAQKEHSNVRFGNHRCRRSYMGVLINRSNDQPADYFFGCCCRRRCRVFVCVLLFVVLDFASAFSRCERVNNKDARRRNRAAHSLFLSPRRMEDTKRRCPSLLCLLLSPPGTTSLIAVSVSVVLLFHWFLVFLGFSVGQ